ncbi:MAG: CorA family divalent cation transporter [Clostridiaceae bacterium]|nr:CorA family divalent cation transporter [Clostridiaceae bacterium]
MRIYLNGNSIEKIPESIEPEDDIICLISDTEWYTTKEKNIPGNDVLHKMLKREDGPTRFDTRFESHDNFDSMCIMIPNLIEKGKALQRILIYMETGRFTMVYQPLGIVDDLITHLESTQSQASEITGLFLKMLIRNDFTDLGNLEEEISNLEDYVSKSLSKNIPRQISGLRRHLLRLRRYYESLFALLEDIEENHNGLFNKTQLRALHILASKTDHLIHTVQILRDYVTQVRESYQAQMDIQLNSVMKFFTAITSIFLPLTLITGWYGMNLKIPEIVYGWMYPLVIILSIAIVIVSIVYFKIKKWF